MLDVTLNVSIEHFGMHYPFQPYECMNPLKRCVFSHFSVSVCACERGCTYYLPVVVEVAQLVGKPLHVVRFEATAVVDHIVVSGRYAAHTHSLTHNEEVIPEGEGRESIQNIVGSKYP